MPFRSLLLGLALLASQAIAETPALTTIAALDVPRYMGTWYEIARTPNCFQINFVGQSRSDYQLQGDGSVQVINLCRRASGEMNEAIGQARQLGGPTSPKLEVRFAPAWLSFIPAVWGDYWVVDIDEAYQWVIVSEPSRKYLWLLARQPRLATDLRQQLLQRLERLGFSTAQLLLAGE